MWKKEMDSKKKKEYKKVDVGFNESGKKKWRKRQKLNIWKIKKEGKKLEYEFRCLEKKS